MSRLVTIEAATEMVPALQRAIAATREDKPAFVECVTREERRIPGLS
ncbi:hypothetical protein [Mesorhizobium sp. STM 4661]|nr:hypothetical protein [Mesorhizobium sp. STM 4661]